MNTDRSCNYLARLLRSVRLVCKPDNSASKNCTWKAFILVLTATGLLTLSLHKLTSRWETAHQGSELLHRNERLGDDAVQLWNPPRKETELAGNDVVTFVLVVCGGTGGEHLKSSARQIKQATTLIKSAAYLSSRPLRFILASDSKDKFNAVAASVSKFPLNLRNKCLLEFRSIKYPPQLKKLKELFRPCATQRVFIDLLLPEEDAVIYLDTDLIFLRSPEALWDEFGRFNSVQLMAAALPTFPGNRKEKLKNKFLYDDRGFNSGITLLNLTRLKNSPENLTEIVQMLLARRDKPKGDQDILNYFANQHSELFYELDCEWNFRFHFCSKPETCPGAQTNGAYAVHGLIGGFLSSDFLMLKSLYEVWRDFNASRPLADLVKDLENALTQPTKQACSPARGVDKILLQQLYERLQRGTSL